MLRRLGWGLGGLLWLSGSLFAGALIGAYIWMRVVAWLIASADTTVSGPVISAASQFEMGGKIVAGLFVSMLGRRVMFAMAAPAARPEAGAPKAPEGVAAPGAGPSGGAPAGPAGAPESASESDPDEEPG